MFELKKLNVHKLVETEAEKDKLTSQGFAGVIAEAEKVKEDPPGGAKADPQGDKA